MVTATKERATKPKTYMTVRDFNSWIKALECGEYRQVRGASCEWNEQEGWGFCATGVAFDLFVDDNWEQIGKRALLRTGSQWLKRWYYRLRGGLRNSAVFGTMGSEAANRVQQMNDAGVGFEAIANWARDHRKMFCGR